MRLVAANGRHTLIGAEVSLYTGKVRAYLKYKKIAFDEVLSTPDVYREIIIPRTGVRFIPVLISDDDVAVQDSSAIIDFLESRHPTPSIEPEGEVQRFVARLFELYADEWLLLPAMHYRWNVPENRAFAIREFGRVAAPNASEEEQLAIGEQRAQPFAGALPRLGIHPENATCIERSYAGFLVAFGDHLVTLPFVLGSRPSIADFALFGPLYAHLFRDPASGELMRHHASRVADWVVRMREPSGDPGTFIPNDEVPSTLEPILKRMFVEFGPVLANTAAALAAANPAEVVPRALGTRKFVLEGVEADRAIMPFNLWRWQRACDVYQGLSPEARSRADALLARVGGLECMNLKAPYRLDRVSNRLVCVASN